MTTSDSTTHRPGNQVEYEVRLLAERVVMLHRARQAAPAQSQEALIHEDALNIAIMELKEHLATPFLNLARRRVDEDSWATRELGNTCRSKTEVITRFADYLFHSAIIALISRTKPLDLEGGIVAWFLSVATRRNIDEYYGVNEKRKPRKETKQLQNYPTLTSLNILGEQNMEPPSMQCGASFDHETEAKRRVAMIIAFARETFTAREFAIFCHRYVEDLSTEENARRTGRTPAAVRTCISDITKRLAQHFAEFKYLTDDDTRA